MTNKNDFSVQRHVYDDQLCQKISMAIVKSQIFGHINPSTLIRKRYPSDNLNSLDNVPVAKKVKQISHLAEFMEDTNKQNICKSPDLTLSNFLPTPDTLFLQSTPKTKELSVKSECVVTETLDISVYEKDLEKSVTEINQNSEAVKVHEHKEKSPKREVNREKQNLDLSNLATSILPPPTQLFAKQSMLSALECKDYPEFITYFKESIPIAGEILPDDLGEIMDIVIQQNALHIFSQILLSIRGYLIYQETVVKAFFKNKPVLDKIKNDVLDCLQSMVDFKIESSLLFFITTCASVNYWNKVWTVLSKNNLDYILPEPCFITCMSIFLNYSYQRPLINNETLLNIITYIVRHRAFEKMVYLADIWLWCVHYDIQNKELNYIFEREPLQNVFDSMIDKLNRINEPSFFFAMKILTNYWNFMYSPEFCDWFAKLISSKTDVRKCLFTVKEEIHALTISSKQDLFDYFYLLGIRVISFLNKTALFTVSKSVYENFLKTYFVDIKRALLKVNDKFKLKWALVECLVSSADYEKALYVLKEFEVLKDLEASSVDYNKVKEILPNLVWHLLNSSQLLPVIVLFEQVVSIFIFNESIDSAYTKNCNEIFDLIVIKAFESNNVEVVQKMISLLDLILSADINFEISKESLRYLAVAAVRANVSFKELLDFTDTCFRYNVFEKIQIAEDGFGSFVIAHSNLTHEEIVILITWMCRHVKINLVKSVQSHGSTIKENIMKVCSIKFHLRPSPEDDLTKILGAETSFNEFLIRFSEALNNPKYLKHPIKFFVINDVIADNGKTLVCDSRIVYNSIYYSDI